MILNLPLPCLTESEIGSTAEFVFSAGNFVAITDMERPSFASRPNPFGMHHSDTLWPYPVCPNLPYF